jgi:hypothetical protein
LYKEDIPDKSKDPLAQLKKELIEDMNKYKRNKKKS